jgi:hypothetical protein
MWQVIATDGTRERQVLTCKWQRANNLAKKALDMGWKVRIKSYFADILIAEPDGSFVIIARKIRLHEAAKFSILWLKQDDCSGCVVWPHGKPVPPRWSTSELQQTGCV